MTRDFKPRLRPLDFKPVVYQGQPMWFLHDPLQLSQKQLFLPQGMGPLLVFMDGTRTVEEIHAAFCAQVGVELDPQITLNALARLNEACLLDNDAARSAKQTQLFEYRLQPYRPPALAGHGYPADPVELSGLLNSYAPIQRGSAWQGRGIVSPHIDYERGGPVYAKVWQEAETAVLEADLVLIFGTDHYGGPGTITLTPQPYATPYGVLPTDLDLITHLAEAVGIEAAFADELNHRHEHSVELSAVWLHHVFQQAGRKPCPMVPILVGSFQHLVSNGKHPRDDGRIAAFLQTLQRETAGKRVLSVASVDLAHVGPGFGDPFVMDQARRAQLTDEDRQLMAAALDGDAETWYKQIAAVEDRNRICGFAPTYLMLRYLGPSSGIQVAYDHCPADAEDNTLVSICGLLID